MIRRGPKGGASLSVLALGLQGAPERQIRTAEVDGRRLRLSSIPQNAYRPRGVSSRIVHVPKLKLDCRTAY
jgi:hypothetical protein